MPFCKEKHKKTVFHAIISHMCFKNKYFRKSLLNLLSGDSKNMKKINSRIIAAAFVLLTLLAGGLAAKQAVAPGSGGWYLDPNPDGG